MDELTPDERDWSVANIAEHAGPLAVTAPEPIAARLAGVWRFRTDAGAAYYLKRYPQDEPRYATLEEHFSLLRAIAAAVERHPALSPYRAIACWPERRLILSQETPGAPIAWLHRQLPRSAAARTQAEHAWAGTGQWLSVLHGCDGHAASAAAAAPAQHAAGLADYTRARFERWAAIDRGQAALAQRAIDSATAAARALQASPAPLVACHGDVSTLNILAGERIGLIDFDDLRQDFAATDLSLVQLEIAQFSKIGSLLPLPGLADRFRRAFRAGYARPWPEGAAFRLPHLRNLAVFVLTLAQRDRGPSLSAVTTRAHYRATIAELRRTIADG